MEEPDNQEKGGEQHEEDDEEEDDGNDLSSIEPLDYKYDFQPTLAIDQ